MHFRVFLSTVDVFLIRILSMIIVVCIRIIHANECYGVKWVYSICLGVICKASAGFEYPDALSRRCAGSIL